MNLLKTLDISVVERLIPYVEANREAVRQHPSTKSDLAFPANWHQAGDADARCAFMQTVDGLPRKAKRELLALARCGEHEISFRVALASVKLGDEDRVGPTLWGKGRLVENLRSGLARAMR